MNFKFLVGITLTIASISVAIPSFSQSAPEDKISFSCKEMFEPASGEPIPATVAWVPQRRKNVTVIYWKSEHFAKAGWNGQARCEEVSPKFQTFYENGRLNYLTNGEVDGYPVICAAVTDNGEICNGENQLFQLKRGEEGSLALQRLMDINENSNAIPLYQSSGEQVYVPMDEFLLNAPVAEE